MARFQVFQEQTKEDADGRMKGRDNPRASSAWGMMRLMGGMLLMAIVSVAAGIILSATVAITESAPLKVTIQWGQVTAVYRLRSPLERRCD